MKSQSASTDTHLTTLASIYCTIKESTASFPLSSKAGARLVQSKQLTSTAPFLGPSVVDPHDNGTIQLGWSY